MLTFFPKLAFPLIFIGVLATQDLQAQDTKQLLGTWVTTDVISGGKNQEVEAKLEFTAEKCTITMEGWPPEKCSYSIEAEKSPKYMDLVLKRRGKTITLPAIYELEDGELKICHPLKENGDRPESMESNPSNVLFYCKRKKPDARENPKETTQLNASAPGIVWKKQPLYGAHGLTFPSRRWFSDGSKLLKYVGRGPKFHIVRISDGEPLTPPIRSAGHGVLGTINNNVAYSADYEGLRLWNASSGKPIGDLIPHKIDESSVIPPLVLANGRVVVRNRLNEVQFWDTKTLKPISKPLHQGNDVDGLQCSEDESLVFVSTRAKTISVYNAKETTRVAGPISGDSRFLHLPKQEKLLTVELRNITRIRGSDRRIETLMIRSTRGNWNEVQRVELPGRVEKLIELDEGQILIALTLPDYTGQLVKLSLREPQSTQVIATPVRVDFNTVATQDKKRVITIGSFIRCWDVDTGNLVWSTDIDGHTNDAIRILDDSIVLYRSTFRGPLYGLDLRDGEKTKICDRFSRFTINDNHLVVGDEIWSLIK